MKTVLLIGMGQFGRVMASELQKIGNEVMVVDKNESVINAIAPQFENALVCDCLNEYSLKSLDVASFDECIVCIGDDFQSSLEITSLLKEFGAKHVISKASTEIQKKFLLRNGADEVIYPDFDTAQKLAVRLNSGEVFDFFEIDSKYAIFEIAVPDKWANKRIIDVKARMKYGINILMIKQDKKIVAFPDAEYSFRKGEHMVVFGSTEKIMEFTNKKGQ